MTILVHIQVGSGPIGVWRIRRGQPESFYDKGAPESLVTAANDRLKLKGKERTWEDVFNDATHVSPYESQYVLTNVGDDNDDLDYLLRKVQRLARQGQIEPASGFSES